MQLLSLAYIDFLNLNPNNGLNSTASMTVQLSLIFNSSTDGYLSHSETRNITQEKRIAYIKQILSQIRGRQPFKQPWKKADTLKLIDSNEFRSKLSDTKGEHGSIF